MNYLFAGHASGRRRTSCSARLAINKTAAAIWMTAAIASGSPALVADQAYVTAGIGGGPKALNSFQGIIYAPFGNLSDTGLLLRGWNRAYRFSYQTSFPDLQKIKITTIGFSIEAEAGWQIVHDFGHIAIFGGIVRRDFLQFPKDPFSDLGKTRIGFSMAIDGEFKLSSSTGLLINGSFLHGLNQHWLQLRPYKKIADGWKVGIEGASMGGKNYHHARFGVFASDYELSIWPGKRFFLAGQSGIRLTGKGNSLKPYAELSIGYLF